MLPGDYQSRHGHRLEAREPIAIHPTRHYGPIHLPTIDDVAGSVHTVQARRQCRIDEYRLEIEQAAVGAKPIAGPQLDIAIIPSRAVGSNGIAANLGIDRGT